MIVSDLYPSIQDLLMGRTVPEQKMADAIRKMVLEITENYDCYLLQLYQAPQQFTAFKRDYVLSYFFPSSSLPYLQPGYINKIKAFFLFTDPYKVPASDGYTGINAGYNLTFRTFQNLQVLLNVAGLPIHWTRQAGTILIAPIPDKSYWFQMCLQREHPWPNAGTPDEGTDYILLANDWQEIVEYGAAQRLAQIYNLSTKATELRERLRGDSEFQRTEGIEGQPGLIFQRTSQEQRDQTTTVKQFRLKMGVR